MECTQYYVTDALSSEEDPFIGWLHTYSFLEERHEINVETGPQLLVNQSVVDGRLPNCMAKNTAGWLLGREVGEDDAEWLDELATGLLASDFDYATLVYEIVTSERYRRVE